MAQPDSTPSTSSVSQVNGAFSGAGASSSLSSSSPHRQEDGNQRFDPDPDYYGYGHDRHRNPELGHQHAVVSDRRVSPGAEDASAVIREDGWSCVIVILAFWFFVSMTLILGVYGPMNMRLGPNSSVLIELNPFFVQSIKVTQLHASKPGLNLLGFYKSPALDVLATWSEIHQLSVPADSHKELLYSLNEGSYINVSYRMSESSSALLIIAQGTEGFAEWLEDPAYPNTTLSWNLIHGSGMLQQEIYRFSNYYIGVGNLNPETIKVTLDVGVRAHLYNTTESYYKCTFASEECRFNVLLFEGNAVVLTSPAPDLETTTDEWYVRLSYKPRWITYIVGMAGMTALMLVASTILNKFQYCLEDRNLVQNGETGSHTSPLLSNKDDDCSSLGSSYDSVSNDDGDLENLAPGEGERSDNTQRTCAICFDAPRNCFFLPCGHCASCFECGKRIAEAAGSCPICRRKMKKVKRIYTV